MGTGRMYDTDILLAYQILWGFVTMKSWKVRRLHSAQIYMKHRVIARAHERLVRFKLAYTVCKRYWEQSIRSFSQ